VLIVYSADGEQFVVKNMIPGDYEYQQDLQKPLASCPYVRTVVDGLPGPELFIYPYLKTDLLQFTHENLTNDTRKGILKSALFGLAALHDRHIIHTGK
jgi:serine/threonine protein kinase